MSIATTTDHSASTTATGEPGPTAPTAPPEELQVVGVATRAVSWLLDWLVINLGAILAGVGAALVLAIFPLSKDLKPAFEAIAGAAYVVWAAAYFVVLWSMTGQTLGARVMQIRLVTANQGRVRPVRAFVRWFGMNLALLFFGAGYIPLLFGRRPLPDWLAKTIVLYAPQLSLAERRRASLRAARADPSRPPAPLAPNSGASSPVSGDGSTAEVQLREP